MTSWWRWLKEKHAYFRVSAPGPTILRCSPCPRLPDSRSVANPTASSAKCERWTRTGLVTESRVTALSTIISQKSYDDRSGTGRRRPNGLLKFYRDSSEREAVVASASARCGMWSRSHGGMGSSKPCARSDRQPDGRFYRQGTEKENLTTRPSAPSFHPYEHESTPI